MATSFIIIDKNGVLKQQKSISLTRDCLYKKCGFRKSEGFEKLHKWTIEFTKTHTVELWGKQSGKNCLENGYDFSFLDTKKTYHGTLAIIAMDEKDSMVDITIDEWHNIRSKEQKLNMLEYESDEDENTSNALSSGSELEEEEYYYSDN